MTNIGTLNGPITSTSTDGRMGGGFGTLGKNGVGSPWNAGDPLSSPVGPYDDIKNRKFPDQQEEETKDPDDPESIEFVINRRANTSFKYEPNDPYAHKGIAPGNLVPHANTAAAVIVSSSYDRGSEALLKEFISEALHEVTSMSVRVMVQGAGLGNPYEKSSANVHYTNSLTPGDPSIKQKGYGQSVGTKDMYPYVKAGKPTTDGGETMYRLRTDIENDFKYHDKNYTTSDYLVDTMSQEYIDWENVKRHNTKYK